MRRIILLTFIPLFTLACYGIHAPGYDTDSEPAEPAQPTEEPLPTPEGETVKVPHVITDVEVLILESNPLQLQLQVTGYQTDGCEYPVQVEQRREGNEIIVEVYRNVPIAATCIQLIVDYNQNIPLEGEFTSGESYTIIVNDFTVNVTL
ncbi:MAG: hypothetical protein L0154_10990 [Chloroflexi bacterium]|nr:hypothetical protein [Chloroflexota bacterium]